MHAHAHSHSHPAIDIHAHYYPETFLRLLEKKGGPFAAGCDWSNPKGPRMKVGSYLSIPLDRQFIDLDARLEAMEAQKVKVQVLSLTLPMVYWADRDLTQQLCWAFNDALVLAHEKHPSRLLGFAVLPMHEPDLAIKEAERVAKLPGIRGVYLATSILGKELSDESFFPVYERLEALGLPIFLHPLWVIGAAERLGRHRLDNALGNPFDTAVAASYLILDGVLDRFPKLEICLPHAGGALMSVIGRLQHCWSTQPDLVEKRPHGPLEYLRRFYYDTVAHSPSLLAFLIDEVGADRVMLGSDFCYAMGYERPVEVVTGHPRIDADRQALILGGNAARLLKLGGLQSGSSKSK